MVGLLWSLPLSQISVLEILSKMLLMSVSYLTYDMSTEFVLYAVALASLSVGGFLYASTLVSTSASTEYRVDWRSMPY